MERTHVSDVEIGGLTDAERRSLSEDLGTTDLALNHYTLTPGEAFSDGMHTHEDQEEVFYVLEGTATFETPDETVEVGPHEAIRFAPGEFQHGRNESDETLVALALGAPKESDDIRAPIACRECGDSETMRVIITDDGKYLECPVCGTQIV